MASHTKKKRNAPIGAVKGLLIAFAAFLLYTFGPLILNPIIGLVVPQSGSNSEVGTESFSASDPNADLSDVISGAIAGSSTPEQTLTAFLAFLVIFVIFVFWYRKSYAINRSKESLSILFKHWFAPKNLLAVFAFAFVVMSVSQLMSMATDMFFSDMASFFKKIMGGVGSSPAWYLAAYVCILGPIGEELCHRGVEMHVLSRTKMPPAVVIIISGLLFGLMHMIPYQVLYTSVVGMFIGYLCYKTRSILPCIIVHIINNSVSTIFNMVPVFANSELISTGSTVAIYALGVVGVILFATKKLTLTPAPTPDLAAFDAERAEAEVPALSECPTE